MVAIGRPEIAQMYRAINGQYKPFSEGDLATWATLTPELVEAWTRQAHVAWAVEGSWRRESGFAGCLYGPRGEPPWGFVNCVGCQGPRGPSDTPRNVTHI